MTIRSAMSFESAMSPPQLDNEAVKTANAAYYRALSDRDMHAMERVWTRGPDNILIAPPVNPITHIGWAAITRKWEDYWSKFVE